VVTTSNTSKETTLTCNVQGSPEPTIRWLKENTEVSSTKQVVIDNDVFNKVISSYFCEVKNSVSTLTTRVTSKQQCNISLYNFIL